MNTDASSVSGVAAGLRRLLRLQRTTWVFNLGLALAVVPHMAASASAADATGLVRAEALRQGVPVSFALRMARIESGVRCHNHNRRSSASGPLQILRGSARALRGSPPLTRARRGVRIHPM